jgi:epoxide hydrolase-like predicted phosphatase
MTIKAIIFDLGGVLLRTTDYLRRDQLAARLGMSRRKLEELIFGGKTGDRAQRGEITVQEHWESLREQLNYSPVQIKALVDEFFANDEIDTNLLDYVRQLHRTYKTGLLSNAFDDLRKIITERWHIEDAFDDMIISAEVGLVKPDGRIYQLAVKHLGVKANQAVFVDDMKWNVVGANMAGLHGIIFQSPQQLRLDLEQLLNGRKG